MSSSLNIWFNRAYATTYWLAQMLRNNPDNVEVKIFVTHVDATSPVLQAADFSTQEPSNLSDEEYINWALSFCETNSINVFIPREKSLLISNNIEKFDKIGVHVLVNSPDVIKLLDNKELSYLSFEQNNLPTPMWSVGRGVEDFIEKYDRMRSMLDSDKKIIIKPTRGAGASGFRVINDNKYSLEELLNKPNDDIALSKIVEALESAEKKQKLLPDFMIMPYLDSPELSVDSLSDKEGKLVVNIPRTKDASRLTSFSDRFPEGSNVVKKIVELYGLQFLSNTQLRWWDNELVILETNTRASGGLYASSITGINMMWLAIKVLLDESFVQPEPVLGKRYTSVSSFVEIKDNSF